MSYYGREISFLTNNVKIHFLYVKFRIKYFVTIAIKILIINCFFNFKLFKKCFGGLSVTSSL